MIFEQFCLVVHHTSVLHLLGGHFSKDFFQRATALLMQQILKCQLYIELTFENIELTNSQMSALYEFSTAHREIDSQFRGELSLDFFSEMTRSQKPGLLLRTHTRNKKNTGHYCI